MHTEDEPMADEPKLAQMIPVEIEAEMKKCTRLRMSVIVAARIPDVRDGIEARAAAHSGCDERSRLASNRGYANAEDLRADTSGNYHPTARSSHLPYAGASRRNRSTCASVLTSNGSSGDPRPSHGCVIPSDV